MQQMMAAWEAAEFHLLFSPSTFDELITVLSRPPMQRKANVPIGWFLDRVKRYGRFVPGEIRLRGICRDPKDEIFLACAVEGEAHYLVSSDRDLLDLGRFRETCILNPGQFLVALRLYQMSPDEMQRRYSLEALQAIQGGLCLEGETAAKLAHLLV
jgi:putative PIN family toxin of toxin-antitoxin system